MTRISWILVIIALLFAGSTVYLARELQEERARHQAVAAANTGKPRTTDREVPAVGSSTADPAEVSPDSAHPVTRRQGGSNVTEEELRKEALEASRQFLADVAHPAGRARALEPKKLVIRSRYQGLAKYLDMDASQYSQFIDLLAEQELASQENATRCILDKNCRYRGETDDWVEARNREIAAVFGEETAVRYRFFERSGNERQAVTVLRGRLPDNARLSDAKAEELVRAWVEESELIRREMGRVQYGVGMYNNMVYAVMQADPDGQRAAAAEDYNRRWRERAAGVLNPEQLTVFTQLQDDTIEQMRAIEQMREAAN